MLNNAVTYYSRKTNRQRNNRNLKYLAQNRLSKVTSIIVSPQAIIYQLSVKTAAIHQLSFQEKPNLVHFAVLTY